MQFLDLQIGDHFTIAAPTEIRVYQKTSEYEAALLATKNHNAPWGKDIDWYDPEDALARFYPDALVTIGRDVEDYLY